jgi:hypothetical protein
LHDMSYNIQSKQLSGYDTIHPSKITDVRQNLITENRDRGAVGSSLGYGKNTSTYQSTKPVTQGYGGTSRYEPRSTLGNSQYLNDNLGGYMRNNDYNINSIYSTTPSAAPGGWSNQMAASQARASSKPSSQPQSSKFYFYESPSKLLSLKKFSEEQSFAGAQLDSVYQ